MVHILPCWARPLAILQCCRPTCRRLWIALHESNNQRRLTVKAGVPGIVSLENLCSLGLAPIVVVGRLGLGRAWAGIVGRRTINL